MSVADPFARVAASGTDPQLLARVVARLLGPRGDPRTVAREVVQRGERGTDERSALLAAVAPDPGPAGRAAAATVAGQWVQLGVHAAVVGDTTYPRRLAAGWPATGGPLLLAWRGPASGVPDTPAVAIVGARRASGYGTGVAAWLAAAAAAAGVLVVSGGAIGIDAAAHGAAADRTSVVLGSGHAVGYPKAHARPGGLFDHILDAGGWLLSELPPDAPPRPANVLARNRIVAGLVDAVVVVEGGERSGSLRTAECAAERGVAVLAVPGDVRAPGSAAPHRLLAEGAAPCTGPADLLDAVGVSAPESADDGDKVVSVLPPDVHAVLARRWPRPVRLDELAAGAGIPVARLLAVVTRARVAGEVAESPDGVRLSRDANRPRGRRRT
ncbi:MAG: DNA-processing protein DprA [Actinobacteria bacterium]|nr:DNA-processing protein DprA [Actinomycetota bacterium]